MIGLLTDYKGLLARCSTFAKLALTINRHARVCTGLVVPARCHEPLFERTFDTPEFCQTRNAIRLCTLG
jgi:hypothetical protein